MTTQNPTLISRIAWTNIGVVGATTPYYAPLATGAVAAGFPGFSLTNGNAYLIADGFDHIEFRLKLVSSDVNNTLTATIQADDGTTGTFEWQETPGCYCWVTGAYGAASLIATNTTSRCRWVAYNHNAKLWHVTLAVQVAAGPAVANNSGVLEIRGIKV